MANKFSNLPLNQLVRRGFSAKAVPNIQPGAVGEIRQAKLPNGMVVAAIEDHSPVTRIGCYVRAGSRFETADNLGVTHCLRNAAGLSTKKSTIFGITRNIDYLGGSLTATSTRDDIIYQLTTTRDNAEEAFPYLADVVSRPAFKPWEIADFSYRMKVDNYRLKLNPEAVLMEALHKACFRGGLSNSLYAPDFMISSYNHSMLMDYVNKNFLPNRIAVVGQGIDHDMLMDLVEKFCEKVTGDSPSADKSKFVSSEVRIESKNNLCYVAVVAEGASSTNAKDVLAANLFQQILGVGPKVRYGSSPARLQVALAKEAKNPFLITSLNAAYSGTGLFGFFLAGCPSEMHTLVKSGVTKMRDIAKSLKDNDLKLAKTLLKANLLMSLESGDNLIEEMGSHALNAGKILSANEILTAIDSITIADLQAMATKVVKGRGAMASLGKIHNVPYLEDLA